MNSLATLQAFDVHGHYGRYVRMGQGSLRENAQLVFELPKE